MNTMKLTPEGARHAALVAQHLTIIGDRTAEYYRDAILLQYMCEAITGETYVSAEDATAFPKTLFPGELSCPATTSSPKPTAVKPASKPKSAPTEHTGASTGRDPLSAYGLRDGVSSRSVPWKTFEKPGPTTPKPPPRQSRGCSTTINVPEGGFSSQNARGSERSSARPARPEVKVECSTCNFVYRTRQRPITCPACRSNAISVKALYDF